ncbi:MurR/RpiR family transcriptional regulator [Petroclostridium sp. X23]|uniref:MurR/RpiR family transcriptional regulator n=1 Tax=Petroclostridium sp. X23 TaxID=3045146 RepID=UPI0024AD690D|nr:MurR/RpiR family transcriptional regulator [Petroclostridium sp. X23]WHH57319.1 MurR/RpiR family transcriptional regulator [Petroclostridium sp. X23]
MTNELNQIPGCLVRIENIYSSLRDSEKKVSDYIKGNYQDIIHLTITELAEKSETSESTIVRLCKSLGYRGFQELKINLAREIIQPSHQIHEALEKSDDVLTIKQKVFNADAQAIHDTLKVLDDNEFKKAVELISQANHVEMYGVGGSSAVVLDAQHKFLKVGLKCSVYTDTNLQAMSASLLGKGDVVIGISHSGGSKDIIEILEIAKEAGAATISITNYSKSPILKVSDVVLFTASKETAFKSDALASRIAELAIIDALFVAVSFTGYEKSFKSIQKTRDATASRKY